MTSSPTTSYSSDASSWQPPAASTLGRARRRGRGLHAGCLHARLHAAACACGSPRMPQAPWPPASTNTGPRLPHAMQACHPLCKKGADVRFRARERRVALVADAPRAVAADHQVDRRRQRPAPAGALRAELVQARRGEAGDDGQRHARRRGRPPRAAQAQPAAGCGGASAVGCMGAHADGSSHAGAVTPRAWWNGAGCRVRTAGAGGLQQRSARCGAALAVRRAAARRAPSAPGTPASHPRHV